MSILTPRFKRASVQQRYERLLEALKNGPMTAEALCEPLFSAKTTVIPLLRILQQEPGREIRVAKWKRARTGVHRLYGLGSAPDAPRLAKRTKKQQYKHVSTDPAKVAVRRETALRYQRRKRAKQHPTLVADVLQHIRYMREVTTPDIALHMRMSNRTVFGALLELEHAKQAMRMPGTTPILWVPYVDQLEAAKADIAQVVRKRWAPMPIPKQSIFAALGL